MEWFRGAVGYQPHPRLRVPVAPKLPARIRRVVCVPALRTEPGRPPARRTHRLNSGCRALRRHTCGGAPDTTRTGTTGRGPGEDPRATRNLLRAK